MIGNDRSIRDQAQTRWFAASHRDTRWMANELDRLDLLVPEAAGRSARDPLVYALAYVERYQGDVLQLEHEYDFLSAAVLHAWQRAEFDSVIRLVAGIAPILSRLGDSVAAVRILRLGIDASRHIQDVRHLARFTNRLGGLLCMQGRYRQGIQLWRSGLELGRSLGPSTGIWEPLSSFMLIADILDDYEGAQRYAGEILRSRQGDDLDGRAAAFFIRGFHARANYKLDRAYEDFSQALRLLSATSAPPSPDRQLFAAVVQTEWSRLQGAYTRSQAYAESALALAHVFSDPHSVATLLIDQSQFTIQHGSPDETRAVYLRLRDVSRRVQAPHIRQFCRTLERSLAGTASERQTTSPLYAPLSDREQELLRLIAAGRSNQDIAEHLVITRGTVKKHLEHIYTKLDVHSRTAAVAKARMLEIVL